MLDRCVTVAHRSSFEVVVDRFRAVEVGRICVLTFSASHGRVAKWQTRTVQVRVLETGWGFNSPLAHSG